jgi:hypothetical protein
MRLKLTLLLVALNGALLALLLYLDRAQSTRDLLAESTRIILNDNFLAGLSQIQLSNFATSSEWIIEKKESNWFCRKPFDWKANPFAVDQLLFELNNLRWDSRFSVDDLGDTGQSLDSYGLQTPSVVIKLTSTSETIELAFGTATEIGNRLYLLSPDKKEIFVVQQQMLNFLKNSSDDYLNPDIVSLRPEEVSAVQIQDRLTNNTRVRLEKRAGAWELASPVQTSANPEAVQAFLDVWCSLQTDRFLDASQFFPESAQEHLRFTLESPGNSETLLLIAPEQTGEPYIVKRDGFATAFTIKSEIVDTLRSVQSELREKQLLQPYANNWSSMEIQFGTLNVSLQQLENGAWQVLYTSEDGQLLSEPADSAAIENLRSTLDSLQAQGFVTDAPSTADMERFSLTEPQRLILLRREKADPVEFVVGGLYEDSDRTLLYAKLNTSNSVFLVRPDVLSTFSLDPFAYRERTLFSLNEGATIDSILLTNRLTDSPIILDDDEALLSELLDFARLTRVQRLMNIPFADPLILRDQRQVTWAIQLEVRYTPSPDSEEVRTKFFYISKRLGGNTMFIGDPQSGLVGSLPTRLIEPLDKVIAKFPEEPTAEEREKALTESP